MFTPRYTALTHREEPWLQARLAKYGMMEIENGSTAVPCTSLCAHRSVRYTLADVMTGKRDYIFRGLYVVYAIIIYSV